MSDIPVFIDIDWDFFPTGPRPGETVLCTDPETGCPETLPPSYYSPPAEPCEAKSDYLRNRAWNSVIRACRDVDVDISDVYGIRPDRGSATPDAFFDAVERRFDPHCPLWVADSHAGALDVLRKVAPDGGVRIIHFDAHHDLGYHPTRLADEEYLGRVSCESWLWWAMRENLVSELVLIYPDWLDRADSCEADPVHLLDDEQSDRVRWTTWSDWQATARHTSHWGADTCGTFLARSGWWTPPWLDADFAALARRFTAADAPLIDVADDALAFRGHAALTASPAALAA